MKRLFGTTSIYSILISLLFSFVSLSQTTGDFRSKGSGNWNDPSVWESYDGSVWSSSSFAPKASNSNVITIISGHTLTVTESDTIDQTIIESGAALSISPGDTLTILNGDGIDLDNHGTIDGTSGMIKFDCDTVNNGGVINPDSIVFNRTSGYSWILGSGEWRGVKTVVASYPGINLLNDVIFYSDTVHSLGGVTLNNRTLTCNSKLLILESGFSSDTGGALITNCKTMINVDYSDANLIVNSDTVDVDPISGSLFEYMKKITVRSGGVLRVKYNKLLRHYAPLIVETGGNIISDLIPGNSQIVMMDNGDITNNGTISVPNVYFTTLYSSSVIRGSGIWNTVLNIGSYAGLTLQSNITVKDIVIGTATSSSFTIGGKSITFLNSSSDITTINNKFNFAGGKVYTQGTCSLRINSQVPYLTVQSGKTSITTTSGDSRARVGHLLVESGDTLLLVSGKYLVIDSTATIESGAVIEKQSYNDGNGIECFGRIINNGTINTVFSCNGSNVKIGGTGIWNNYHFYVYGTPQLENNITLSGIYLWVFGGGRLKLNNYDLTYTGTYVKIYDSVQSTGGKFITKNNIDMDLRSYIPEIEVNSGGLVITDGLNRKPQLENPVTIKSGAFLTRQSGDTLTMKGSLTIESGATFYSTSPGKLVMHSPVINNNGTISASELNYNCGDTTIISGTGVWPSLVRVQNNTVLHIASTMNFLEDSIIVDVGSNILFGEEVFNLNGSALILNGNIAPLTAGSNLKTSGTTSLVLNSPVSSNIIVNGGTTTIQSDSSLIQLEYPLIIQNSGTLSISANKTLKTDSTVTVQSGCTLTSVDTSVTYTIAGSISNNGTVSNMKLNFTGGETYILGGTGNWNVSSMSIKESSTLELDNDMNFNVNKLFLETGSEINLGSHNITLGGDSLHILGSITSTTGILQTQSGAFKLGGAIPPLSVISGTMVVYNDGGNIHLTRPVMIMNGAELYVNPHNSLQTDSLVEIASGSKLTIPTNAHFNIAGSEIINNGTVAFDTLHLNSGGTSQFLGDGIWRGSFLEISNSSILKLASNTSLQTARCVIDSSATLDLQEYNLSLLFNTEQSSGEFIHNGAMTSTSGKLLIPPGDGRVTLTLNKTVPGLNLLDNASALLKTDSSVLKINYPISIGEAPEDEGNYAWLYLCDEYSVVVEVTEALTNHGHIQCIETGVMHILSNEFKNYGSVAVDTVYYDGGGTTSLSGSWQCSSMFIQNNTIATCESEMHIDNAYFTIEEGSTIDLQNNDLILQDVSLHSDGSIIGDGTVCCTRGDIFLNNNFNAGLRLYNPTGGGMFYDTTYVYLTGGKSYEFTHRLQVDNNRILALTDSVVLTTDSTIANYGQIRGGVNSSLILKGDTVIGGTLAFSSVHFANGNHVIRDGLFVEGLMVVDSNALVRQEAWEPGADSLAVNATGVYQLGPNNFWLAGTGTSEGLIDADSGYFCYYGSQQDIITSGIQYGGLYISTNNGDDTIFVNQDITINNIRLGNGVLKNGNHITLHDSAYVRRESGQLTDPLTFGASAIVSYELSDTLIFGYEMPPPSTTLLNLSIQNYSGYPLKLDQDRIVSGNFSFNGNQFDDNGKTLTVKGNLNLECDHSGSGKIKLADGSGIHEIYVNGSITNLELDDPLGATVTSNDLNINGILNIVPGSGNLTLLGEKRLNLLHSVTGDDARVIMDSQGILYINDDDGLPAISIPRGISELDELYIYNANGGVLSAPLHIDYLALSSGPLFLGNHDLLMNRLPSKYVYHPIVTNGNGRLRAYISNSGTYRFPVSCADSSFNHAWLTLNTFTPDTFSVRVSSGVPLSIPDSSRAVRRVWEISEAVPGETLAEIKLQWYESQEGSNFTRSAASLWKFTGSDWVLQSGGGEAVYDEGVCTISATGVTSFSPFVVGNTSGLPVELSTFTAVGNKTGVILKWQTVTEVNNYGFEIERRKVTSDELRETSDKWLKVGFISGSGTSNSPNEYSFADSKLPAGRYEYRLKQIDLNSTFKYSQSLEIEIGVPKEFALYQNYPNPFNPSTTIKYDIPNVGTQHAVSLRVYDILGKEVATLVSETKEAGSYEVTFNASQLASGVYFYKLQAGNYSAIKKLLLLK